MNERGTAHLQHEDRKVQPLETQVDPSRLGIITEGEPSAHAPEAPRERNGRRELTYDVGCSEQVDVVRLEGGNEVDNNREREPHVGECEPAEEELIGVVLRLSNVG